MKLHDLFLAGAVILSLTAGTGLAAEADKEKKQAEIRKTVQAALPEFYKAEPKLKDEVAKAPGYAVFSTFGLSFIIGGAGGKGLVHDNKANKDTFMHQAEASVGIQAGISEYRTLIVFQSAKAMNQFIDKGWEATAGGGAGVAVAGKGAGGVAGSTMNEALYYTLTRNGLQAGGAIAGTKFWKDKDLN